METYGPELNRIRSLLKGSSKGLTVTEISRSIEINRNSVAKYLDVLLSQGQVEMKVVGSAKVFSLTKRIPISSILSLSSDYIIVLDDDFIVTYVNDNIVNFEKKSFDEIIGKPYDHLPVSFLSVPDIVTLLKEGISGKELSRELEITNDNKTYYFRAKFVPSLLENRKKGLLIILEDITEIKQYQHHLESTVAIRDVELTSSYKDLDNEIKIHQEIRDAYTESERRYSKLIELAQEGVWTFDPEGNITFINQKCSEILGYSLDEIQGTSIFSYTDDKNTTLLKKYIGRLKSGKTGHFEITFIRKDKSPVFVRLSASSSVDEHGTFLYGLFLVSDISELKRADDALRESEIHYRTLIETLPNGILMIDPDGRIKTANFQASKMLGYKKTSDLIGKNLFDYIAPNDIEKCHTNLQTATEKGSVKNTECTLISNENSAYCVDINMSVTRDSKVTPTACVCVISDITERRKAEHKVRKSEEKHRALVEGISHIIFTTDLKGRYTYVSPVIKTLFGYSPDELIGKHFYSIVPSEERQKIGIKLKEALSGKFTPNDFKMIDKAGNIRWVRIMAQPLREDDKLIGVTGLIGDINDWKQTEDALQRCELQYKAVVEDQTDMICRFDMDRAITFVNPAYCRYYRKKPEDFLQKDFLSFIQEKSHESVKKILGELTLERPVWSFEHEISLSDLDIRWHHLSIRAIFNADGEKIEYQSSSRDITELKTYFEKSSKLLHDLQDQTSELESQKNELKKLKTETERSEKKYLTLYDSAPVGYLTVDLSGKIIELNQTGSILLGITRDALIGAQIRDYICPDSVEIFNSFFLRVFADSKKESCEVNFIRHDTYPNTFQIEGEIFVNESVHEKLCHIVIIDATERVITQKALKESEDRFRIIVEQSPVVTYVVDKNGIFTLSEGKGLARLGLKPGEVIGLSVFDVYRDNPAICDACKKALSGEPQEFTVMIGTTTFETFLNPVKDKKGVVTSFIGVSVDISDRVAAEETIKNATKKLNMLNSINRHDIINQITALSGYLEIVDQDLPESSPLQKPFSHVKESAHAINRLIQFSRDYQTLGLNPATWFNIDQLVEKSLKTVNPKEVNFDISVGSVEIFADPLIENVFTNLVDNSVRHGKQVTDIRINFRQSNGNGIIVYEDNGVGISRSEKKKLFNRDFGKKSGFGLYLSKEILNYTGISIQETGEEMKGARFEIIVPKTMYKLKN